MKILSSLFRSSKGHSSRPWILISTLAAVLPTLASCADQSSVETESRSQSSKIKAPTLDFSSMEADEFPSTMEEFLRQYPDIPTDQNAAAVVYDIANREGFDPDEIDKLYSLIPFKIDSFDSILEPSQWSAVDQIVKKTTSSIEDLKVITEMDQSKYPIEKLVGGVLWFNQPLLPHLGQIRNLSKCLRLHAYHHLKEGNESEFIQILKLQVALQDTLKSDWPSMSRLFQWGIANVTLSEISNSLSKIKPTHENLKQLREILNSFEFNRDLRMMLVGERMVAIDHFSSLNSVLATRHQDKQKSHSGDKNKEAGNSLTPWNFYKALLFDLDPPLKFLAAPEMNFQTCLTADFEAATQFFELTLNNPALGKYPEYWETWVTLNEWSESIEQQGSVECEGKTYALDEFKTMEGSGQGPNLPVEKIQFRNIPIFSKNSLTAYINIVKKHALMMTQIRIIEAAINTLEYMQDNEMNVAPKNLEEFSAEFRSHWPNDPFTGKPLNYQGTETGIRIYSYGRENLKLLLGDSSQQIDFSNTELEIVVTVPHQ